MVNYATDANCVKSEQCDPTALLLYVPITDPTSPYHSLIYLASFARTRGFRQVHVRDTNVEALLYCSEPSRVFKLLAHATHRRDYLLRLSSLTKLEELELAHCIRATALTADRVQPSIATLRNPCTFYHYNVYRTAVGTMIL